MSGHRRGRLYSVEPGHRGVKPIGQPTRRSALFALGQRAGVRLARALLQWTVEQGIQIAVIDPGKPWQNGTTESFNGRLRDECLNMEWFRNRIEARIVIEDWRRHYNEVRPHPVLDI